jgi:hypothetical protein
MDNTPVIEEIHQKTPIPPPKSMCRGPKLQDEKSEANISACVLQESFGHLLLQRHQFLH